LCRVRQRDGIASWLAVEQPLGVRVLRRGKQRRGPVLLHAAAVLHHRDPVGQLSHYAEVVSDKQQAHVQLVTQLV